MLFLQAQSWQTRFRFNCAQTDIPSVQSLSRSDGRRRVSGMRHFLLMIAVVMGQSVLAADKKPLTKEESAKVIEKTLQ